MIECVCVCIRARTYAYTCICMRYKLTNKNDVREVESGWMRNRKKKKREKTKKGGKGERGGATPREIFNMLPSRRASYLVDTASSPICNVTTCFIVRVSSMVRLNVTFLARRIRKIQYYYPLLRMTLVLTGKRGGRQQERGRGKEIIVILATTRRYLLHYSFLYISNCREGIQRALARKRFTYSKHTYHSLSNTLRLKLFSWGLTYGVIEM